MYSKIFLFAGLICLIGQIILDNTTLTPGHITSSFVVIGASLDIFDIYDCEQLKDLYMKALEIREKVLSPENFEFIKNLDFDIMIKEELIKLYEKLTSYIVLAISFKVSTLS